MKRLKILHLFLLLLTIDGTNCLIITSVLAGPKKFKTISFDHFFPPLSFVQPNLFQFSFRGHKTFRRPNYKLKANIPLQLPISHEPGYSYPTNSYDYGAKRRGTPPAKERIPITRDIKSEQLLDIGEKYEHYQNRRMNPHRYGQQRPHAHKNSIQDEVDDKHHPYTGKAQISSWIDNGHFVHTYRYAKGKMPGKRPSDHVLIDEAFEDQVDGTYSDHLVPKIITHNKQIDPYHPDMEPMRREMSIHKMKTFRLGYNQRPTNQNYFTALESIPSSVPAPLANSYAAIREYYSSPFTAGLKSYYPGFNIPHPNRKTKKLGFIGKIKDKYHAYKAYLPELHIVTK